MLDGWIVAQLSPDAPPRRLSVVHPGLCLDAIGSGIELELRVPAPKVADATQGHFRTPADTGRHTVPESTQQPKVCRVTDRIVVRIKPQAWSQSHRGGCATELLERYMAQLAPFNPTELAARHAAGKTRGVLAQPCRLAGQLDLTRSREIELPRPVNRSVFATPAARHVSQHRGGHSTRAYQPLSPGCYPSGR